MEIRQEKVSDYAAVYELVKTAFATASEKDGDEQDYVNELRKSERYIPELALVAEENGVLIGHIMLTQTRIKTQEETFTQLLLSPLCVEFSRRNTGVGAKLVHESFRRAKAMGYSAVFVVGEPKYYARFGFRRASEFGIMNDGNIPEPYVMVCELTEKALDRKNGTIQVV